MSPEFLLSLLTELGGYEGITKVWIVMNEQGGGHRDLSDGRRVFTKTETHYIWKGDNGHKLWELDSEKWRYIKTLEVEWEDKSIFVTDHFTTMNLHGFYSLPDIKSLPGQKPQQIVLKY